MAVEAALEHCARLRIQKRKLENMLKSIPASLIATINSVWTGGKDN